MACVHHREARETTAEGRAAGVTAREDECLVQEHALHTGWAQLHIDRTKLEKQRGEVRPSIVGTDTTECSELCVVVGSELLCVLVCWCVLLCVRSCVLLCVVVCATKKIN